MLYISLYRVVLSFKSCSGLQKYLNQLGFSIVGYGCTTCIGNSGDIHEAVASAIVDNGKSSSNDEMLIHLNFRWWN